MNSTAPSSSSPKPTAHATSSPRRWWFRVGALLVGLLPLVLLEGTLRIRDVARPADDPLAGIGGQRPLFERVSDVYRTARAKQNFFGTQEFPVAKPTNGFRVFAFGGSTVYGHPYLNDTAFPKWLELELAARAPGRQVQAINCGGISYASYRLAYVLREALRHQPDLVILAMGHNDFLEDRTYDNLKSRSVARHWLTDRAASLRTVAWLRQKFSHAAATTRHADESSTTAAEVDTRLDHSRAGYASYRRDPGWHTRVLRQFEDSFRAMLDDCRAANVPVIIVTLGSNLRDCPPFKSEHRAGLSPAQEDQWQRHFDDATAADLRDDLPAALSRYRDAEAIDPQHALLCFRIARRLDRLGQASAAREYFLRSKDEDVCPLRMLERPYQFQLALAAETRTPLVDARTLLESLSPDALPGNDLYLDHVHPTLGGHQQIARALAAKVHELRLLPTAPAWAEDARRAAYAAHLRTLPPAYFANGRRRVDWLENWAKRHKLHEETLPRDAFAWLRLGIRQYDLGETESAEASLALALRTDPRTAPLLAAHARDLMAQGRIGAELMQRLMVPTNGVPVGR
ncbi:MAG: GDSL-type esterase/lipase family protein [Limisphaerales bacterium]